MSFYLNIFCKDAIGNLNEVGKINKSLINTNVSTVSFFLLIFAEMLLILVSIVNQQMAVRAKITD